jgi:hypothetical protein
MSSIAGSSRVRSTTSVFCGYLRQDPGRRGPLRAERQPLPLTAEFAPNMDRRRDIEVGTRLGQVDDQHALQRHPRSEPRERSIKGQAARSTTSTRSQRRSMSLMSSASK